MKKEKKVYSVKAKGIAYMNYAKWLSMIMVIIFMALILYFMVAQKLSYVAIIQENPILLAGFIDCLGNIIVSFLIKKDVEKLYKNEDVLYIQAKTLLYVTMEACLLNMPSMIFLIISSMKCYLWDKKTIMELWKTIKNRAIEFVGMSCLFLIIVICFYWILTSFSY